MIGPGLMAGAFPISGGKMDVRLTYVKGQRVRTHLGTSVTVQQTYAVGRFNYGTSQEIQGYILRFPDKSIAHYPYWLLEVPHFIDPAVC